MRGRYNEDGTTSQQIEIRADEISNALTTVQKDSLVIEAGINLPAVLKYQRTEYAKKIRKDYERGKVKERRCNMREYTLRNDGLSNTITTVTNDHYVDTLDFYSERCWELEDELEKSKTTKPIINKSEFCRILSKLKKNEDFIDEINDVLRKFGRDGYMFSTGLEDVIVRLLETVFEDTDEWISYWAWEENFGRKYEDGDAIDEKGGIIPLKTAEDLYDFLIKDMEGKND